ncbi:MAG: GlsB/YeaQ/YmgE family stress response membrane protein [Ktedonobacteraceae bacterium]
MTFSSLVLADISLTAVIWWVVVGLIAGFLASLVMRGGGYGIVGDIVVGLVGALIGGFLASLVGLGASGFIGTIIVAFIGACILIAILRAVAGTTGRRRTL